MRQLKAGDRVSLKSHGGKAEGKVVRKVTESMTMKEHKVAALKDNPEYLVQTDEGKRAAHRRGALTKS
jgi:protein associated with RNAse G/E